MATMVPCPNFAWTTRVPTAKAPPFDEVEAAGEVAAPEEKGMLLPAVFPIPLPAVLPGEEVAVRGCPMPWGVDDIPIFPV